MGPAVLSQAWIMYSWADAHVYTAPSLLTLPATSAPCVGPAIGTSGKLTEVERSFFIQQPGLFTGFHAQPCPPAAPCNLATAAHGLKPVSSSITQTTTWQTPSTHMFTYLYNGGLPTVCVCLASPARMTTARMPPIYMSCRTAYGGPRDNPEVDAYLKTLPTNVTYFTVAQLTSGLGVRPNNYKYHIPSNLRIIGFFAGGSSTSDPGA